MALSHQALPNRVPTIITSQGRAQKKTSQNVTLINVMYVLIDKLYKYVANVSQIFPRHT